MRIHGESLKPILAGGARKAGARIRLNTNGHASLIHGRDLLEELGQCIDAVNVSLNAPEKERYLELCQPESVRRPDADPIPLTAYWDVMLDFLTRAPEYFESVQASVVGFVLTAGEIEAAERLAVKLGATFRVR